MADAPNADLPDKGTFNLQANSKLLTQAQRAEFPLMDTNGDYKVSLADLKGKDINLTRKYVGEYLSFVASGEPLSQEAINAIPQDIRDVLDVENGQIKIKGQTTESFTLGVETGVEINAFVAKTEIVGPAAPSLQTTSKVSELKIQTAEQPAPLLNANEQAAVNDINAEATNKASTVAEKITVNIAAQGATAQQQPEAAAQAANVPQLAANTPQPEITVDQIVADIEQYEATQQPKAQGPTAEEKKPNFWQKLVGKAEAITAQAEAKINAAKDAAHEFRDSKRNDVGRVSSKTALKQFDLNNDGKLDANDFKENGKVDVEKFNKFVAYVKGKDGALDREALVEIEKKISGLGVEYKKNTQEFTAPSVARVQPLSELNAPSAMRR